MQVRGQLLHMLNWHLQFIHLAFDVQEAFIQLQIQKWMNHRYISYYSVQAVFKLLDTLPPLSYFYWRYGAKLEYQCSTRSRKLHNLEIVLRILRIRKLHANPKIVQFLLHVQLNSGHRWWRRSCKSSLCTFLTFIHEGNSINIGHILKPPCARDFGKFSNLEKLPSPWSGYGCRENPDLLSIPVQGFTNSESSHLSSVMLYPILFLISIAFTVPATIVGLKLM